MLTLLANMADNDAATTATAVTFRRNHLVRLRGFNHHALDGKLVRIDERSLVADARHALGLLQSRAGLERH